MKVECQDVIRQRKSSHNGAGQKVGRILESIPEEELKEFESARGHQNIQNINNDPIGYLEEKKTDAHASSIIQPKSRILDMKREDKDVIDLSDSPSRKRDSINIQSEEEKIKISSKRERENDKEDGNIVIVSKKKSMGKEEDEDYYPFDTGMKCNMF